MGLLNDFFGKDEINQLKKQLIEKTNEVTRLESSLSTLTNSQLAFEQKVAQLNKAVADGSVSHNALHRYASKRLRHVKNSRIGNVCQLLKAS
jgi:septal ring factor EnvC (AmiA/AmiB activator)